jgi:G:T-mismatch repair DNA endonuclease (very short patch repair protein)
MDEDFSDLLLNSYIAIPSNHSENKRKFWIAKVDKIVEQDEKNVFKK